MSDRLKNEIMKKFAFLLIVFVLFGVSQVNAQKSSKKIVVSGVVTDVNKQPVAGAIILIDGRNTNATTDSKGFYQIKVKRSAKMIQAFSFQNGSGSTPFEGNQEVNIVVDPSNTPVIKEKQEDENDEEVNLGYGTAKKNSTSAHPEQVNPQESRYASYSSIYDILREIPGVQVNGKTVVIRGASSINGSNDPLFVVDGSVVNSIDYISPREVKRITVLKGADTAIYGVRGANGVILITLMGAGR